MIEQDHLKRILNYNKDTGIFIWLVKPNTSNNIGDIAGSINTDNKGRKSNRIGINGKQYYSSILAWIYVTGKMPKYQIDHEDGNSLNDAWVNLQDVSNEINCKNQSLCNNNTSGYMGVTWFKPQNNWQVRININGERKCLGYFNDLTEAIEVRKAAEKENNYHINHGRIKEDV